MPLFFFFFYVYIFTRKPTVSQEEPQRTGYHSSHWRQSEGLQLERLCLHADRFRPG